MNKSMKELLPMAIMKGRRVAVSFLLCVSVLHPLNNAVAQNVKSTFDRSVDFTKYKKYAWGSNYLLTRQTKEDQERINMAIIDSINRNLQALGFVEDDKNPDFRITYEAGGLPKADVGAQRNLYAADMANYSWGNVRGISSDVWVYSLAKLQIAVTDATTKNSLWQAMASLKIRDPIKFGNNLKENVDKFIQKTMKSFPPKK
jgi:Domain of unknown function (DUF4136)